MCSFLLVVIDTPEDEEIPKVSTKFLKEQFEKSAQEKVLCSDKEATPAKQIKVRQFFYILSMKLDGNA